MSMKGIVLNKYDNRVAIERLPIPQVGDEQVLVKVIYTGICGTDIKLLKGQYQLREGIEKVVVGHEFVGTVVELGNSVENVNKGDRVTAQPTVRSCRACQYCHTGNFNLCKDRIRIGFDADGSFAEYIVLEKTQIYQLPESLSNEASAMIEPLTVAVRAVYKAEIKPTDTVLITGPGTIGLLTLLVAKQHGCRTLVCGTKMDEKKLKIATDLGADKVFINEQWKKETGNERISIVFECTGQESAVNMGLELIEPRGQYIQVGTNSTKVEVDFMAVAYKELRITGSIAAIREDWLHAIELMVQCEEKAKLLIDKVYPIQNWETGLETLLSNGGPKILIQP
jgi:L-iditol 2-dehydrogenase